MKKILVIALLASCGGSNAAGDDDDVAADADPFKPDADPNAPDARPPGTPDAAPAPALPVCWQSCGTPADCVLGSAIDDVDNWACDDGKCTWTGCNSTAECTETYMSSAYVCGSFPNAPVPSCYQACSTPAQCGNPSVPLLDADNYACDGGKCRWTGCNSTDDCTATYMSSNYVCDTLPGSSMPSCYQTCSTPTDCDNGVNSLFSADNYECNGGKCVWTGCNSTGECTDAYMSSDYVCD